MTGTSGGFTVLMPFLDTLSFLPIILVIRNNEWDLDAGNPAASTVPGRWRTHPGGELA